ncbi:hypothetical protein EQW78_08035 [Oerskovia turbata]|uniref:Uncharacterized protein n=1 Tax=Oerskovia turbata TaxID=1713 RepID=A0A4Q1KW08_9CELL|nr:hypothetical protein [Oerskovia turbata]RXR26768.1 hypothetical protein EQW73_04540 [Oerskovia turbata]RXR34501.1 hypothetical protein EQW78_08035 [Oerskovia turbata]TGJ97781.1 hypothetical protein DLJ96_07665 [Actinotalea fermentans ATCC 43279 = JCM 9966 = DSM 3133]
MNSMLRAALGTLVHVLTPGAETSGDSAASAAASATGSAAWSVDLFGALGRLLDARVPGEVQDTPETLSAE